MTAVKLTRLSGLGPFTRVCEEAGDAVLGDVLRRVGVPRALIDRRQGLIPVPVMFALFGEGARRTGNELFGLHLGRAMGPADFGAWSRYALLAPTLGEALLRARRAVPYHQPGSTFSLSRRGDQVIWRCHPAEDRGFGLAMHADHLLMPMLRAVRLYLGEDWLPDAFHVPYRRPGHAHLLERELRSRIMFEEGGTGLSIPTALLDTNRPAWRDVRPMTTADLRRMVASRPARTMSSSVQGLIAFGPESRGTNVDTIAGMLGVTVRGLQRRLQEEGTTFRELLARSRTAEAMALVRDTDLPLVEIAWLLGYSELPHFSRAFAREVGRPPSAFRHITRGVPTD